MANPFRRLPDGGLSIWSWLAAGVVLLALSALAFWLAFGFAMTSETRTHMEGNTEVVTETHLPTVLATITLVLSGLGSITGAFMLIVGTVAKGVEVGRRASH